MENKPTPHQAIAILDSATHPANISRLTRADFANAESALKVLLEFVEAHTPKAEEAKKE